MRRRTLLWIGVALFLVTSAVAGYIWFLLSPPDPVQSAERIELCETIVLAALGAPSTYRRANALELRQLVIIRVVAIAFRTTDSAETSAENIDTAVCIFANPFASMYGRPGMIRVTVKGRPVAQSLVDAVAAKWVADKH
jgi:hypothetical protein